MVNLIREITFHKHVSGEKFSLCIEFATPTNFDNILGRHEDFVKIIREAALSGAFLYGVGDFPLEIGIGVNDIPALAHLTHPQCGRSVHP
jgi:hypothetical protein